MNAHAKAPVIIAALMAALSGLLASSASSQTPKPEAGSSYTRVLVALKGNWQYEGNLRKDLVLAQRASIAQAQARVIAGVRAERGRPNPAALARVTRTYVTVPGLALELRHELLDRLRQLPDVALVYDDQLHAPSLAGSTPVVGSHLLNDAAVGVDGAGQVVAIIDTGVDRNHPFLGSSRFVANACFSDTSWFTNDRETLCPNGEDEQIGGNAGENCTGADGCDHGTHVAGIVGGYIDSNGNGRIDQSDQKGVAPRVKFITMQVFHRQNVREICAASDRTTPCVTTSSSDYIAALDRVNLHLDDHPIAAANLSLGGGRHTGHCDFLWLEKWAIDDLRSRGTATVVATGNENFGDAIGHPACISTAISVGNTTNNDGFLRPDGSTNKSNTSSITSLLAPGTDLLSSVPGSGFAFKNGTSMAAPHVAGIWALMKQDRAARGLSTSVDPILSRLRSTGRSVTRAGVTIPRVDAVVALDRGIVEILPISSAATMLNGETLIRPVTLRRRNYDGALSLDGDITSGNGTHLSISFSNAQILDSNVDMGIAASPIANGTYGIRLSGVAGQVRFIPATVSLTVNPSQLALASISFDKSQVTGGTSLVGTATLNGPTPASGFTAQVNNSSPSATLLPSPFPVTFTPVANQPLGQASFTIGTRAVHTDTTVTMGAGGASQSFIVRSPRIQSLAIAPQVLTPGTVATATAALNGPAASSGSPGSGAALTSVTTGSSNAAVASVSGIAVVMAGSSSTTFPVTAASIASAACATITGTLGTQAYNYIGVSPGQSNAIGLGPDVVYATTLVPATIILENKGFPGTPPVTYTLTTTRAGFALSRTQATLKAQGKTSFTVTPDNAGCAMVTAQAGNFRRSVLVIASYPPQG